MKYWLFKSEPSEFSIDDLASSPRKTTYWDGVRNYQARNFMRDDMRKGDLVLYYHSNCDIPGVVGIAEITRESYVDHTAFDSNDKHYDAKSTEDSPRWCMVDIRLKRKFSRTIALSELRKYEKRQLKNFVLLRKGNRLSIVPTSKKEWDFIVSLE